METVGQIIRELVEIIETEGEISENLKERLIEKVENLKKDFYREGIILEEALYRLGILERDLVYEEVYEEEEDEISEQIPSEREIIYKECTWQEMMETLRSLIGRAPFESLQEEASEILLEAVRRVPNTLLWDDDTFVGKLYRGEELEKEILIFATPSAIAEALFSLYFDEFQNGHVAFLNLVENMLKVNEDRDPRIPEIDENLKLLAVINEMGSYTRFESLLSRFQSSPYSLRRERVGKKLFWIVLENIFDFVNVGGLGSRSFLSVSFINFARDVVNLINFISGEPTREELLEAMRSHPTACELLRKNSLAFSSWLRHNFSNEEMERYLE